MAFASTQALNARSGLAGTALRSSSSTRTPSRARCLAVRARKTDITQRSAAETGYLKEDSAGQENIFAVESKSFVAGSSKDTATNSGANAAFAGLAFAIAAGVLGGGAFLAKDKTPAPTTPALESAAPEALSTISQRISAGLAPVSAPAVAE